MWHFTKLYAATFAVVLALDGVWLGILMKQFYKAELGVLARRQGDALNPIWWAALVVYLMLPLGIIWFVLPRVSEANLILSAALWGFIFGVITYGVYDWTNYATLESWPIKMTIVDMFWGGTICGISSIAASTLDRWFS